MTQQVPGVPLSPPPSAGAPVTISIIAPGRQLDNHALFHIRLKKAFILRSICAGRISINGKTAKPSSDVNVGDVIEIRFGSRSMTVCVDSISEYATKAGAAEMYTVISESGATQDAE